MNQSSRRPKLGQHFLRSEDVCRRIADSLPIDPGDLLVEIGPGRGGMTRLLASRSRHLTAVEIDPALAAALQVEFRGNDRVEILEQDILLASLDDICGRNQADQCYVFGNLPYYITSPILFRLFGSRARIRHMTVLVQLEVAKRLTARPGGRDYGYLSVWVQCLSRPKILFDIPPGAFSPPPKVDSALMDFQMILRFPAWGDEKLASFLRFAQSCFAQKRKSLLNNLSPSYSRPRIQRAIESFAFKPSVRAEQLGLEDLASVFGVLG